MKRGEFIRQLGLLTGGVAFGVEGVTGKAFNHNPLMMDLATTNGKILVLIQLQGGNDGMNMVVPFEDALYYNKRPGIAQKKTDVLPLSETLGLHPSMTALRELYDTGQVATVMNVGYSNPSRSHFRATDIWMTASDASQVVNDGWAARFLTAQYPDFPAKLPEQPMAIQLGSVESLLTLSQVGSTATVFDDPALFYQLVTGSQSDNDPPPATLAGEELKFLKQISLQSLQYSGVIKTKADKGKNTVSYPNTNLGKQLGIVAKLISGGIETPVYLVSIGGFDTHANQLTQHANLLKQVSEAIAAFQSDLMKQSLGDQVTVMTFSEFGRRLTQNGTSGTDHGTAAPLFVVGKTVQGGILGGNPNLADLDSTGDIIPKYDFRQVYSTVLRDHLGMTSDDAKAVLLGKEFTKLPIFRASQEKLPTASTFELYQNAPNPAIGLTNLTFALSRGQNIRLSLLDLLGQELMVLQEGYVNTGQYSVTLNVSSLPAGQYIGSLLAEDGRKSIRLIVRK